MTEHDSELREQLVAHKKLIFWRRLAIGALVALVASFVAPQVVRVWRARQARMACMFRLRTLGVAFDLYTGDHGGELPPDLSSLQPYLGQGGPALLVCPANNRAPGRMSEADDWSDYHYLGQRAGTSRTRGVILFCSPENHGGYGAPALFSGGQVKWCCAEDLAALKDVFEQPGRTE
ncbi:MAG: hypothetical protein JXR37_04245 [Kiritimatiellae bacterium]|nr:hypothetical protein [Kiritimatiellia bacterium]